jgi:hypothetical protein
MPISVIQRTRAIRFLSTFEISILGSAERRLYFRSTEGYHNAQRNSSLVEEFRAEAPHDNFPLLKFFAG